MRFSFSALAVSLAGDNASAAGLPPSRAVATVGGAPPLASAVANPPVRPPLGADGPRLPNPPVILSGSPAGAVAPGGPGVAETRPGVKAR